MWLVHATSVAFLREKSTRTTVAGVWKVVALVAAVFLSACDRPTAQVKQAAYRPQYVYQKYCAPCHDATNLHLIQEPPRLDGLFQKKTFPSGAPATDDELRNVILHGRGTMPPFEGTLNADDVDGLVRYMHTR